MGPGLAEDAPVVRALIVANVGVFLLTSLVPDLVDVLGMRPDLLLQGGQVWGLATSLFVHGGVTHLLFNMLGLWMFGTEAEQSRGGRWFLGYYLLCGLGASLLTVGLSLVPFGPFAGLGHGLHIGASGAIYGVLLAYGTLFPERRIALFFVAMVPARIAVLILGGLALLSAIQSTPDGVGHTTHLGGLVVGWILLRIDARPRRPAPPARRGPKLRVIEGGRTD